MMPMEPASFSFIRPLDTFTLVGVRVLLIELDPPERPVGDSVGAPAVPGPASIREEYGKPAYARVYRSRLRGAWAAW